MKLHQVLFDELYARGVRHIFGIPGDFVLNLYEALSQDGRFQLVTFSHEPAVGFAADGASRITNGLGVCVVTYGAGGLNLLNSVACAYAEESPLIVITGGPGKSEKRLGVQVHHEVKSYDSQFKIYQEVTEFGAVLDDHAFVLRYFSTKHGDRLLVINLGIGLTLRPAPEPLLAPPAGRRWKMKWSSECVAYGGYGTPPLDAEGAAFQIPAQCAVLLTAEVE